jgi:S-adenosylmethionine synthetase
MTYLFTSESVSEGHPDKVADQISDAILDEFLKHDPNSKVACETLVTTGLAVVAGEVRTSAYVEIQDVPRNVINDIGYNKAEYRFDGNSCGIISTIHAQSDDIFMGVERENAEDQGAGDQGMMFGYACKDLDTFMPLPIVLSHLFVFELAQIRKEGEEMKYLRPDSKSQVTIEYDDNHKPIRIHTVVLSTQHDEFSSENEMREIITKDFKNILIPRVKKHVPDNIKELFKEDYILHINPTGNFVIGGPHGDAGLTGRKIIVDTYGGKGAHGGGAFSGKDSSKVDRSAAYASRHIAKNMVAAGVADEVLVQLAYAIGVAKPVGLFVNTYGTANVKDENGQVMSDGQIAKIIEAIFDLRPAVIIDRLGLKNPIFRPTSKYGHFGRDHFEDEVEVFYQDDSTTEKVIDGVTRYFKKVEFFTWEKLDYVDKIKSAFKI